MTVWVLPWQRNLLPDRALDIPCTLSQWEKEVKHAYPTNEFERKIDEEGQFCANQLVNEVFARGSPYPLPKRTNGSQKRSHSRTYTRPEAIFSLNHKSKECSDWTS
jgi:hypothetical protein